MSMQITKKFYEFIRKKDIESAFKNMSEDFLCTHVRHELKFNLEDTKSIIQARWDSGSEDEHKFMKVIGIGNYTLALEQIIIKKYGQIIGRAEDWILFEWKDNKGISVEVYTDMAVFDKEVTEKWLNSLDIEYEMNGLTE